VQNMQMPQNYTLPARVAQQAGFSRLGALVGVYQPLLSSSFAIIGVVVGVIVVDILLLFAFILLLERLFYILLYVPIVVIIYGIYAFTVRDLRVYEFSNGLIRTKGDRIDQIRWDYVISIIQQRRRRTSYLVGGVVGAMMVGNNRVQSFTVHCADGASFKFGSNLRGVEQLHQNVQRAVTQQHLPRVIAAYNNGAPIPFGPLTVSLQGLSNGRITVIWREVQDVEIKQGQVIIKKAGKAFAWAKISLSQVPNLFVFMGLVHYARTGRVS
jgi:hypothetical protein